MNIRLYLAFCLSAPSSWLFFPHSTSYLPPPPPPSHLVLLTAIIAHFPHRAIQAIQTIQDSLHQSIAPAMHPFPLRTAG